MKTEKISVNLSPLELGQIDLLVDRGFYDSRSDFMRAAARKSLEDYTEDFKQFLSPDHLKDTGENETLLQVVGIAVLTKNQMENYLAKGIKIHIRVTGLLTISSSVTAADIRQTVLSCKIHGKLVADKDVKAALEAIEADGN